MTPPASHRPAQRPPAPGGGTRIRGTRQGKILADVLGEVPEFRSAQDIHGELRRRGERIGLATVYRHLQALRRDGTVDAIQDQNGETLYRRCRSSGHHHHVTCRSCGHSIEVEGRAIERWAERVAAEAGFVDVDHTVEIFGLCPDCAQRDG
jgi:Fur family ferric uptake transcriptional regulator